MRIESVRLRDVGPFKDSTVEFPEGTDADRADVHLLVGENGTGKTTLLRALGAAFDATQAPDLLRRFGSAEGSVEIRTNLGQVALRPSALAHPPEHGHKCGHHAGVDYFVPSHSEWNPDTLLHWTDSTRLRTHQAPLGFAAFSYGTYRLVSGEGVAGSAPLTSNPLACERGGGQDLARWLINTSTQAALAGRNGKKNAYEVKLLQVEEALTKIFGQPAQVSVPPETLDARIGFGGQEIELDLLPDGMRSILSWIGDLYMRLDRIPWVDDLPPRERGFALFLDEVGVHLHPRWQRKILHVFQDLFPKAQVFVSTHSPYVVGSVSDASIHPLTLDEAGNAHAGEPLPAQTHRAVPAILAEVLGVESEFNEEVEERFEQFKALTLRHLRGEVEEQEVLDLAAELQRGGGELATLVAYHLRSMHRQAQASQ